VVITAPGGYWCVPVQTIEVAYDGSSWWCDQAGALLNTQVSIPTSGGAVTSFNALWKIPPLWVFTMAGLRLNTVPTGVTGAGASTDASPSTNGLDLVSATGTPALTGAGSHVTNNVNGTAGGISGKGLLASAPQYYDPGAGGATTVYAGYYSTGAITVAGALGLTVAVVPIQ
jgi:hypothetical protein